MVSDNVIGRPRGNVEILPGQAQHHRGPLRRRIGEIERERCLHLFRPTARPEMEHHHEIAGCGQRPGGARHRDAGPMSWCPVEKESVGRARGWSDEPFISRRRIGLVVAAR